MQLAVQVHRSKARRVATLSVPPDQLKTALERLRAWALTRGVSITSGLSWVAGEAAGDVEARCPIPSDIEVHPDTGIYVRKVPSQYLATVQVRQRGAEPAAIAEALGHWADDNGYDVTGPYEIFGETDYESSYDLALPLKRRPRHWSIDV